MKVSRILSMYAELLTSSAKTVRLTHVSEFSQRMLGASFCCCADVNCVNAGSPSTVEINFAGRNQRPKDTAPPGGQCAVVTPNDRRNARRGDEEEDTAAHGRRKRKHSVKLLPLQ